MDHSDNGLLELLEKVEAAIDTKPSLRRPRGLLGEATLEFSRQGWTAKVRAKGPRRRVASELTGFGLTPVEAASDLIAGIEAWWS